MLLLAAAAITASAPQSAQQASVWPMVQAQATVRIVSGVRLRLGEAENGDAPAPRDTVIHTDGTARHAKLIEFE